MRMAMPVTGCLVLLIAAWGGGAHAQSGSSGASPIHLSQAWARRAPMMGEAGAAQPATGSGHGHAASGRTHGHAGAAGNGAVYVLIENRGTEPDALLEATSDAAATVEFHETRQEGGVMRMRPVPRMDVPPGGRIEMKPGGYHIMLLGLTRDLHPGDTVTVRLRFEKAGEQSVEAPVR
jgi:copper(I)-binding protein